MTPRQIGNAVNQIDGEALTCYVRWVLLNPKMAEDVDTARRVLRAYAIIPAAEQVAS